MKDTQKTREQLISELNEARGQLKILAAAEVEHLKADQDLKQLEEKFYKAFHSSPQAIVIATLKEERFIEVNESFTRLTGFTREELIGHTSKELGTWVNYAERERILRILEKKGRVDNEELQFHTKSGDIQIMLFSADKITIGGEECMISSATDVTEIKKIEQALRDSEEKFYKAFQAIPEAVCIATLKDGIFLEVNDSFISLNGFSREEVIGHTGKELNIWVNPGDRYQIKQLIEKHGRFENEEIIFRRKSGEMRTVLMSADLINFGGQSCILTIGADITERKKMEQALQESEEKSSKAFRASPEGISISTLKDGIFKDVNESFCRIIGYSRQEIIGHSSKEFGLWANPDEREDMIDQLKKHGRVSNREYQLRIKSGEIRVNLFSGEQIVLDGEPCLLSITNDITEYKRMEAQALEAKNLKQVDKLRTELLANVSHELRTPLASIKGFATMLMDYDKRLTSSEKREYLETIDKNTDRLVELIEQLLEMSRLGVGMLSIKKAPTNIITLCQTVISEARVRAPEYIFKSELPLKLPKINIDDRRIRQVLDHVIDNAVKYSNPGTEIALSVQKNNNGILFTVTDHGIGIPKSDLPRVFSRMFHSTRGQKTGVDGAGLGLAICKGLIEAHGGKIWLESKEGDGTKCFFTLPLDIAPEDNDTGKSPRKKRLDRR